MTKSKTSLFEALDLVTGHDEAAIAAAFGADLWDTYGEAFPRPTEFDLAPRGSQRAAMLVHRMAIFADKIHDGAKPAKAKEAVLDLTSKETLAYFAADEDDEDDPDPKTDAGKGGDATT